MPIGAPELIIILVIALLILGPGKLPDVGSALGKSIREFRKASTDIQESVKIDTSPLPPAATPPASTPSAAAPAAESTEPAAPTVTPAPAPDRQPEPVAAGVTSSQPQADPAEQTAPRAD